ncbi:MAG: hypothetical protein FJ144_27605 [Deltaproteobacteria bacterium]|nr:hypothetical protein [Deltaproteobacteria bacterium]
MSMTSLTSLNPENISAADFSAGETCRFFIGGEPFEIWENPDVPFGNEREDIDGYADRGQWTLLWNALVLTTTAS